MTFFNMNLFRSPSLMVLSLWLFVYQSHMMLIYVLEWAIQNLIHHKNGSQKSISRYILESVCNFLYVIKTWYTDTVLVKLYYNGLFQVIHSMKNLCNRAFKYQNALFSSSWGTFRNLIHVRKNQIQKVIEWHGGQIQKYKYKNLWNYCTPK